MIYYDRENRQIDKGTHDALRSLPSYYVIREYNNGSFSCRVEWAGIELNRYVVIAPDEAIFFATEAKAVVWYEHLLATKTDSQWVPSINGSMQLMEVGNKLRKGHTQDTPKISEFADSMVKNTDFGTW